MNKHVNTIPDVTETFPEINEIKSDEIRNAVIAVWSKVQEDMAWNSLDEIPKNLRDQIGQSLVRHIRAVTRMAVAIADIAEDMTGRSYDRDVLLAAGLLHDLSKPLECEPAPGSVSEPGRIRPGVKSAIGKNVQHAVYGAHLMLNAGMSLELVNLIITHTHASGVRGRTWEAAALFYADFADTDAGLSLVDAKMYSEKWQLGK